MLMSKEIRAMETVLKLHCNAITLSKYPLIRWLVSWNFYPSLDL